MADKGQRKKAPDLTTLLARLYYGENRRSMTQDEANAIADSVFNRTELAGYPDTPEEVILQPGQYHPMSTPAPTASEAIKANYEATQAFGPGSPLWDVYVKLVTEALDPKRDRGDYTHYFTGAAPSWAKDMELAEIGAHLFGRENRRKKRRAAPATSPAPAVEGGGAAAPTSDVEVALLP